MTIAIVNVRSSILEIAHQYAISGILLRMTFFTAIMETNTINHTPSSSPTSPSRVSTSADLVSSGVGEKIGQVVEQVEKTTTRPQGTQQGQSGQRKGRSSTPMIQFKQPTTEQEYRRIASHIISKQIEGVRAKVEALRQSKESTAYEMSNSIKELRRLTNLLESLITMSLAKLKEFYKKLFPKAG